jgi:Xaa-Pro aminopeptidase
VNDFANRLADAGIRAREMGMDAVLITPGSDLRYLLGYDAVPLERLTCLVLRAQGDPVLVVPELELLAAQASPAGALGLDIHTWSETQNPYALVTTLVPHARSIALDNHMWAEKVLALRDAMPDVAQFLSDAIVGEMRMRKDLHEIGALREAGAAIDRVHATVPLMIRPGMTEAQVGTQIADEILAQGHVRVDFVIVASGPNGASPHHEVSDRVLQSGDCVVVDIGGTMPTGYRSDCTRTYVVGEPSPAYLHAYEVLMRAQAAAVNHAKPGVTCASVDSAARAVLADAGLGDLFVHRTGHGIGLETHEAPYIVAGNERVLEPGMAFSIEPGFYSPGEYGARIEDIVVVTEAGAESLNNQPHHLVPCA